MTSAALRPRAGLAEGALQGSRFDLLQVPSPGTSGCADSESGAMHHLRRTENTSNVSTEVLGFLGQQARRAVAVQSLLRSVHLPFASRNDSTRRPLPRRHDPVTARASLSGEGLGTARPFRRQAVCEMRTLQGSCRCTCS